MELKLKNGDYAADGAGGFVRLEGDAALAQRVLFRLCARRGAFPLLPHLGSELHLLSREPAGTRESAARKYVARALEEEEVSVESVMLRDAGEGRMLLSVTLRVPTQQLRLSLTV